MVTRQRLSAERSQQLTRLLTITKTANMRALMDASELAKVIALVAADIGKSEEMARLFPALWPKVAPQQEYYDTAVDWFTAPDATVTSFDVVDMLDASASLDQDFMTYLKCLTELHKRRRKYGLILQQQPLPTMVQVSPRALMEYGPDFPPEALASWLTHKDLRTLTDAIMERGAPATAVHDSGIIESSLLRLISVLVVMLLSSVRELRSSSARDTRPSLKLPSMPASEHNPRTQ